MKRLVVWTLVSLLIVACGGSSATQDTMQQEVGSDSQIGAEIDAGNSADASGDDAGDSVSAQPSVLLEKVFASGVGNDGKAFVVGLAGSVSHTATLEIRDAQGVLIASVTPGSDGSFVASITATAGATVQLRPLNASNQAGNDAAVTLAGGAGAQVRPVSASLLTAALSGSTITVTAILGAAPPAHQLLVVNLSKGQAISTTSDGQGNATAALDGDAGDSVAIFVVGSNGESNSVPLVLLAQSGVFPVAVAPVDGSGDSVVVVPPGTLKPGSTLSVTLAGGQTALAQGVVNGDGGLALCLSGLSVGTEVTIAATGPSDEALLVTTQPLSGALAITLDDFVGTENGGAITIDAMLSQSGGVAVVANCDSGQFAFADVGSDGSVQLTLDGQSGDSGGLFTLLNGEASPFKDLQSLIFTIPRPKPDLTFITASFPNASGQSLLVGLGSASLLSSSKPSPWGVLQQGLNQGISAVMPHAEVRISVNNQTVTVPQASDTGSFAVVLDNVAPGAVLQVVQVVNGLASDPVAVTLPTVVGSAPKTQLMAVNASNGTIQVDATLGAVMPVQSLVAANLSNQEVRLLPQPFFPKPPSNSVATQVSLPIPGGIGDSLLFFSLFEDQNQYSVFVGKAVGTRDIALLVSGYNSDQNEKYLCVTTPAASSTVPYPWILNDITPANGPELVAQSVLMLLPNGVLWGGLGQLTPGLSYEALFRPADEQVTATRLPILALALPTVSIQGAVFVNFVTTPAGQSAQVGIDPVMLPATGAYLIVIQAMTGEQRVVLSMDRILSTGNALMTFAPPTAADQQHLFYYAIDLNPSQILADPGLTVLPGSRCEHLDFKPNAP